MLTPQLHPSSSPSQRLIDYYGIKLDGKRLVLMIEDPKVAGRGEITRCCTGAAPGGTALGSLAGLHR